MCEGTCEVELLDVLIERNLLIYKKEDLLYEEVFHLRQLDIATYTKINSLKSDDKVLIYRVIDKNNNMLRINNKSCNNRIEEKIDVLIKPELEILMIIHEGLYEDYLKHKTDYKPSEYYKIKHKEYNKQKAYIYDYFNNLDNLELVRILKDYEIKRKGTHTENELSLYDLLQSQFKSI